MAVEYSSDVLLGLQYEGMDYQEGESQKDKNRVIRIKTLWQKAQADAKAGRAQKIELKVLKNRNGVKGTVGLDFYPMFNNFEEQGASWASMGTTVEAGGAGAGNEWDTVEPTNK